MPLAELVRSLALPKSSVLNLCSSLVDERFLVRGADATYRLGPKVIELAGAARHSERPVRLIGVSVQFAQNPFFDAEIDAVKDEAARFDAEVQSLNAQQDASLQARQIHGLVDNGADLIVVDPVDSQALREAAEYALRNGVSTVAINGTALGFSGAVTTDNSQAGYLAGRLIGRRLPSGGDVAIIDGTRLTALSDRIDGFQRALQEFGGFRVVAHMSGDNTEGTGYQLTRDLLLSGVRIHAIFAINDPSAIGAARACTEIDPLVSVIGVDGSSQAVQQIKAGGALIATAVQDPRALARTGVRLGLELASGARPHERTVLLPTHLVTADDVDRYQPW